MSASELTPDQLSPVLVSNELLSLSLSQLDSYFAEEPIPDLMAHAGAVGLSGDFTPIVSDPPVHRLIAEITLFVYIAYNSLCSLGFYLRYLRHAVKTREPNLTEAQLRNCLTDVLKASQSCLKL